ncbi:CesT family type III secretion system chaperone [Pseudomonas indica]|jgi:hypothetical protein|uniref:CesT family type III secretion system chaperone n=1 Tax=Pseudomonas indica TaxID=137658 RepID=UPI000BAC12D5|nr:CesT family type III secretion system chaperone [Pseudomonas indica]MBU3059574.1 CesT family type III secretion system chaperone [Pseudomonas indica]PAU54749.1 hypothetical protein BZL42_20165 [Pseudomonas indica]
MTSIQAEETINRWLIRCGVTAVNGRVLDAQGCCSVALEDGQEVLVMLPANQTCVYFYGLVGELDLSRDNGVLTLAMTLNLDPAYTRGAALGFDPERRQLLLRAVHPLEQARDDELDRVLRNFGELVRQLRDYVERYRHQAPASATPRTAREGGSLSSLVLAAGGRLA